MVAESSVIKQVLSAVDRVAQTESTVLILGETGVGKELIARAIHQNSRRRKNPSLQCTAELFRRIWLPVILFGHEKGRLPALSREESGDSSWQRRHALSSMRSANLDGCAGTAAPGATTREFERLGGLKTIQSDFRLIAATIAILKRMFHPGRFRADLFYRLNIFPIHVPPLRERIKDIEPLAAFSWESSRKGWGSRSKGIPKSEMDKLNSYHWPGNIRELKNVIERGVILNTGEFFTCRI